MILTFTFLKSAGLITWGLLLSALERIWPCAPRPTVSLHRLGRNGGLLGLNALLNPVISAPIAAAAAAMPLWTRPELLPAPAALVVDLLLLDLWIYFWHRANHEVGLLWRLHEVHHRDEFLDAVSGFRFHPGEVALSALARAPLIVALDIPLAHVFVFDLSVSAAALFHHSNVRLPAALESALRLAIVTPSHHWVHHHARRADTDSNYGTLLTVWDRWFMSLSPTRRTPDMPIGAEGAPDLSLWRLLLLPFRRPKPPAAALRSPPATHP